jgi:hypothetical protein
MDRRQWLALAGVKGAVSLTGKGTCLQPHQKGPGSVLVVDGCR